MKLPPPGSAALRHPLQGASALGSGPAHTDRPLLSVVASHAAEPAPGLVVARPFPGPDIDFVDPWIMLDHFGPTTIAPGDFGGLAPHPHRGFETVTVLFDGAMEHRDSLGRTGQLRPGGVQWMTAASGIVHAEYREREFARRGGVLHGVQLWLNLPAAQKMRAPGYQELPAEQIPVVATVGARVRVIAGTHGGVQGPAHSFTPVTLIHASLDADAGASFELPPTHNAAVYVVSGAATIGGRRVGASELALFPAAAGIIAVTAIDATEILVIGGEPIAEPVVSWGPFVMNTHEEILQARKDYAAGRMGSLQQAA